MKILTSYNISDFELENIDFHDFYNNKKRESCFAVAYESTDKIIALRDHLGIVPLYYRKKDGVYVFSTNLSEIVESTDSISQEGLLSYIGFQSTKIISLFDQVKLVEPGTVIEIDKKTDNLSIIYRYVLLPKKNGYSQRKSIIKAFDYYIGQAIRRSIKSDKVGLYLSGGIDSSLIAYYLKKNGIDVTCYTSIIDENDKHYVQSKNVCEFLGIKKHIVDRINYKNSSELIRKTHKVNMGPGGTTASLNVVSLWLNTEIEKEQQLYFGQNLDTAFMAMGNQYRTFFISLLPAAFRKNVGVSYYEQKHLMNKKDILKNYLSYRSKGYVTDFTFLTEMINNNAYSRSQKLIIAGMYCGHTPADSETFTMSAINRGIIISNPFYDMDLIEFIMSIPLKYKIAFKPKLKAILHPWDMFQINKRIFLNFASDILPEGIIYPKKSMIVPSFNLITDQLNKKLTDKIGLIKLNNIQSQVAITVLENWLKAKSIKH